MILRTVDNLKEVIFDFRQELTLNAIARALKESFTPEELKLLIERLQV